MSEVNPGIEQPADGDVMLSDDFKDIVTKSVAVVDQGMNDNDNTNEQDSGLISKLTKHMRGWKTDSFASELVKNRCEVFRRGIWILIPSFYCVECEEVFHLDDFWNPDDGTYSIDRTILSDDPCKSTTTVVCPNGGCDFSDVFRIQCCGYVPSESEQTSANHEIKTAGGNKDVDELSSWIQTYPIKLKQIVNESFVILSRAASQERFNSLCLHNPMKVFNVFELVKEQPQLVFSLLFNTPCSHLIESVRGGDLVGSWAYHLGFFVGKWSTAQQTIFKTPPEQIYLAGNDQGIRLYDPTNTTNDNNDDSSESKLLTEMFDKLDIENKLAKLKAGVIVELYEHYYSLGKCIQHEQKWLAININTNEWSRVNIEGINKHAKIQEENTIMKCGKCHRIRMIVDRKWADKDIPVSIYECTQCKSQIHLVS